MAFAGVVSACVSRLGEARRRREDSCGAWAALRRAGQPFAGAKGRWQRFADCRSSPDVRWGRPLGDSEASVEACRDRDLSEWGGMGLLEAKLLVVWAFTLVVGHERGAFCLQAVRRTANGQVKAI